MESNEKIKNNISAFAEQGATIEEIGEILQIDNFVDLFNQKQDWQDAYNSKFLNQKLKTNNLITTQLESSKDDIKIIKANQEILNKQIIAKTLKKYHF